MIRLGKLRASAPLREAPSWVLVGLQLRVGKLFSSLPKSQNMTRGSIASRRGAEVKVIAENTIGTQLIEAAIEVHRELDPGLLESVYEAAFAYGTISPC